MATVDTESDEKAWHDYIESVRDWIGITVKDHNDSEE